MRLLVLVLNDVDLLDPLLEEMLEKGVRGATILNSMGMAMELSKAEDYPMFGSLRMMLNSDHEESRTIFFILQEEEVKKVKQVIRDVLGDLSMPDTAIMFTMPILDAEGIAPKE